MNLKRSPFSILDKDKREMDYIKGIYKKKIQSEIDSYKDTEDEEKREIDYIKGVYKRKIQSEIETYTDAEDEKKRDTIKAQDILMFDRISI